MLRVLRASVGRAGCTTHCTPIRLGAPWGFSGGVQWGRESALPVCARMSETLVRGRGQ